MYMCATIITCSGVGHMYVPFFNTVGSTGNTCTVLVVTVVNPRRACAARVTVVVLCVCLSVCLSVCLFVCPRLFSDYRLRGGL